MDNGREGNFMSVPKQYEYAILNLRLKYLEAFRKTTALSDFQLWEVYEFVDKDCQLGEMLALEAGDGE